MAPEEIYGQDFQRNRAEHFSDWGGRQNRGNLGRSAGERSCWRSAQESQQLAVLKAVGKLQGTDGSVSISRRLDEQVDNETRFADEDRKQRIDRPRANPGCGCERFGIHNFNVIDTRKRIVRQNPANCSLQLQGIASSRIQRATRLIERAVKSRGGAALLWIQVRITR